MGLCQSTTVDGVPVVAAARCSAEKEPALRLTLTDGRGTQDDDDDALARAVHHLRVVTPSSVLSVCTDEGAVPPASRSSDDTASHSAVVDGRVFYSLASASASLAEARSLRVVRFSIDDSFDPELAGVDAEQDVRAERVRWFLVEEGSECRSLVSVEVLLSDALPLPDFGVDASVEYVSLEPVVRISAAGEQRDGANASPSPPLNADTRRAVTAAAARTTTRAVESFPRA